MSINSVGKVGPASHRDEGSGEPPSITREGLVALKDRLTESGRPVPDGLDTLIKNFDAAVGKGGSMTREQFRAFAQKNGVELPGRGPRGGGGVAKPPEKPSEQEMSQKTRAQLVAATVKGDRDAIRELERRENEAEAARARAKRPDGVGDNLDVEA